MRNVNKLEHSDEALVSASGPSSAQDGSSSIHARSVSDLAAEFSLEKPAFKSLNLTDALDTDGSSFKRYAADRAIDTTSRLGVPLFNDAGDLAKQKVTSKVGLVTRAAPEEKANPQPELLLWKFNEYALSAQHILCSSEVKELRTLIESTLNSRAVEFYRDRGLSYKCEAWRSNTKVSFCVQVSKLQSSCQKITGKQFVVEVKRTRRCADPFVWRSFATEIVDVLRGSLALSGSRKPRSNTLEFQELIDQKSMDMNSRQISRKYSLGKEDTLELTRKCVMDRAGLCEVLENFLVAREANDISLASAETGAIIAGLSKELGKVDESTEVLSVDAFNHLLSLLTSSCFDMKKATCTIIANVARAGLLRELSQVEVENLLKALTRSVFAVGESEKFAIAFTREAVKAIVTVYNMIVDVMSNADKSNVRVALKICANSKDKWLSRDATNALDSLGLTAPLVPASS